MKLVIFGLSVSSSWGNGHATLWRGLLRALARRGHRIVFFERDVPYYAQHRDLTEIAGVALVLYQDWQAALERARAELRGADVAMVTSYCPDALDAASLILDSNARVRSFYDLDAPVTLSRLRAGLGVDYIGERGLADFDLVLSYSGGQTLPELKNRLKARHVAPLYGSADPELHHPVPATERYRSDLSYLGTYSEDRQAALDMLFLEPARRLAHKHFRIGGSMYPPDFPWAENISFIPHVPPGEHNAFYCSSRMTLNVTRGPMAEMGYCPSARLFEAACCGVPVLSDEWEGLDWFFEPGLELVVARTTGHAMDALALSDRELGNIARAARERTLAMHTSAHRALEMENILEAAGKAAETAGSEE